MGVTVLDRPSAPEPSGDSIGGDEILRDLGFDADVSAEEPERLYTQADIAAALAGVTTPTSDTAATNPESSLGEEPIKLYYTPDDIKAALTGEATVAAEPVTPPLTPEPTATKEPTIATAPTAPAAETSEPIAAGESIKLYYTPDDIRAALAELSKTDASTAPEAVAPLTPEPTVKEPAAVSTPIPDTVSPESSLGEEPIKLYYTPDDIKAALTGEATVAAEPVTPPLTPEPDAVGEPAKLIKTTPKTMEYPTPLPEPEKIAISAPSITQPLQRIDPDHVSGADDTVEISVPPELLNDPRRYEEADSAGHQEWLDELAHYQEQRPATPHRLLAIPVDAVPGRTANQIASQSWDRAVAWVEKLPEKKRTLLAKLGSISLSQVVGSIKDFFPGGDEDHFIVSADQTGEVDMGRLVHDSDTTAVKIPENWGVDHAIELWERLDDSIINNDIDTSLRLANQLVVDSNYAQSTLIRTANALLKTGWPQAINFVQVLADSEKISNRGAEDPAQIRGDLRKLAASSQIDNAHTLGTSEDVFDTAQSVLNRNDRTPDMVTFVARKVLKYDQSPQALQFVSDLAEGEIRGSDTEIQEAQDELRREMEGVHPEKAAALVTQEMPSMPLPEHAALETRELPPPTEEMPLSAATAAEDDRTLESV